MKKVIHFPGWGENKIINPSFARFDVWKSDVNLKENFEADFIVAHSLGCHVALLVSEETKTSKLILMNPLLEKRIFLNWVFRWIGYWLSEGFKNTKKSELTSVISFFSLAKKAKVFLGASFWGKIEEFPKENILVIRGKRDKFFCTNNVVKKLRKLNVSLIEIENMGHSWNEEATSIIEDFINKN